MRRFRRLRRRPAPWRRGRRSTRVPSYAPRRWKSSSARRRADRHPRAAARRVVGLGRGPAPPRGLQRRRTPPRCRRAGRAERRQPSGPGRPRPAGRATPRAKPQPEITPAARRTVDLDAAAAFAATPPPPRMRTPLADANGTVAASGKRRPYRGLSTPALVADLERTLGTRLRPRHATVQKARRGNGDGYEGWLRRHFASRRAGGRRRRRPPQRRGRCGYNAAN